jgi:hypothetical protein
MLKSFTLCVRISEAEKKMAREISKMSPENRRPVSGNIAEGLRYALRRFYDEHIRGKHGD